MHYKHPEVLYFLYLLIIPILVHLFQLQKFKKTPFTNVAFLTKIVQQSRKSSQLKKWLILATRLLLLTALIFSFSQPYFGTKKEHQNTHYYIYLDNSLSMSSRGEKGNLLQNAINELLKSVKKESSYSLQTNTHFYQNISSEKLKKTLINIKYSTKKTPIETIFLKFKSLKKNKINTLYKIILISDFQNNYINEFTIVNTFFNAIQLKNTATNNISIDSVYTNNNSIASTALHVLINNQGKTKENVPIAIYDNDVLKSKQVFSIEENSTKSVKFQLQKLNNFKGKAKITFSDTFSFDNSFYFTISKPKKTTILSIGSPSDFLKKIYTKDEFILQQTPLEILDYNAILKKQFIVLNELQSIPNSLQNSIIKFLKNGGELAIIPNEKIDIKNYNTFLVKIGFAKIKEQKKDTLQITNINFEHSLFTNVFSKKTTNFQYPFIRNPIELSTTKGHPILSLENKKPFLSSLNITNGKVYLFRGGLTKENSNFTNSPLVVPVFYNMAKLSFKQKKLFYRTNKKNTIDVDIKLEKDRVLQIANQNNAFIPQQRTYQNKVKITTDLIEEIGFYNIRNNGNNIGTIAYNQPKEESNLSFLDSETLSDNKFIQFYDNIANGFSEINNKNKDQWLWKWFLCLAIVSLLLEILILKFFKP